MTPKEVARVLTAGHAKTHDPYLRSALAAMIAECEKIETENLMEQATGKPPGFDLGAAGRSGLGEQVHVVQPGLGGTGSVNASQPGGGGGAMMPRDPLGKKAQYEGDGLDHSTGTSKPEATVQSSFDRERHRVIVWFGADEEMAVQFTEWLNTGEWESFHRWRLRQTTEMPALHDTTPQQELPASLFGLSENTPEGRKIFDAYARGGMDAATEAYRAVIHGTCSNEARNHLPHYYGDGGRFFCNGDVGVPVDERKPHDWRPGDVFMVPRSPDAPDAPQSAPTEPLRAAPSPDTRDPEERVTEPLRHVEEVDPKDVYHKFEAKGGDGPDALFCKHCDGSGFAEQHIASGAPPKPATRRAGKQQK